MSTTAPMAREEIGRLGQAFYELEIRPLVESGNKGKIVAIDVLTGKFSVGKTSLEAAAALRSVCPNAVVWLERIGYRTLREFGAAAGAGLQMRPGGDVSIAPLA